MIHFQHPAVLLLLVPIALVAFWLGRRGRPAALACSSVELLRAGARARRSRWGRIVLALYWLGVSSLVVALARPVVERNRSQVHASGVDVMLAVDVSGSMQARDMATKHRETGRSGAGSDRVPESRLDAAKAVVRRFVAGRANDRIGVIAFAGEPYLASPLTLDHGWVDDSVARLDPAAFKDGTAIGSALAAAARRLDAEDATSKIVVLLTDGQNNAGKIAPRAAAEAAKSLGIKVYTVAVGAAGEALVPVTKENGERELVLQNVDVDEETLSEVAETTGGKFFRATDTDSLRAVYAEIDRLEKTTRTLQSFTDKTERFAWFALPGLALVGLSLALSATRFRRVP